MAECSVDRLAVLARACGLSPAALCVAPTGLGSNLAFSQRLRAGLISAAPDGAGLWMLRAARLPPRGWLSERSGFHSRAGLWSSPASTVGAGLSSDPASTVGAGLASSPAFLVGLAYRAVQLPPLGPGLWMLRAVQLPPLGLGYGCFVQYSFHRWAWVMDGFAQSGFHRWGWVIERTGFHRGAGFSKHAEYLGARRFARLRKPTGYPPCYFCSV